MTPKKLVPPVPLPPTDAAGEPRQQQPRPPSRRFRWYGVGIAACVLASGLLLPHFQPKPQAAEKPTGNDNVAFPVVGSLSATPDSELVLDAPRLAPGLPTKPADELPLPSPPPEPALTDGPALPAPSKPVLAGPPVVRAARRAVHRAPATEEDLRRQLAGVPNVGLDLVAPAVLKAYGNQIRTQTTMQGRPRLYDATAVLWVRPDLRTLPFHQGLSRKLDRKAAANLEVLSQKLHAYLDAFTPPGPDGRRVVTAALRNALRSERRGKRPEWLRKEAVPALLQILMAEDKPLRSLLVKLLADISGAKATRALARRAVFDLNAEVRQQAVAALKGRRPEEYREVLVEALRYPWPPPAKHAAEALVALGDRAAAPMLVPLLSLPDPGRPQTNAEGRTYLREVVCVQHLRNCILCHPPALTRGDPNTGDDPVLTMGMRVPRAALGDLAAAFPPSSYGGGIGPAGESSETGEKCVVIGRGPSAFVTVPIPLKVRSDISFLRQDFSVLQPVAGPRPLVGPLAAERQRFDYVIRTRPLSRRELRRWRDKEPDDPLAYPQRQAVLLALKGVTGRDVGNTTEAWQKLFPHAELDAAVDRLRKALRRADVVGQVRLLAMVRDRDGPLWTPALARIIPGLSEIVQQKAREVLAGRLARLPARELRERLRDSDPEIARAALQAGVQNKEMALVPDLIALLEGPDKTKAQLAQAGLTRLTGQSLKEAVAWQAWWKKQAKERGGK